MDEQAKMAINFASEATKQQIVIATAIITFTVTFSKEFLRGGQHLGDRSVGVAWLLLFVSVVFGLWTLRALTGAIERPPGGVLTVYSGNIAVPSFLQLVSFLAGLACAMWAGWKALC
jgi:hypothetical protein